MNIHSDVSIGMAPRAMSFDPRNYTHLEGPVRKVVTRHNRRISTYIVSIKNGAMMGCESMGEGDLARVLETCNQVIEYSSQPKRFSYTYRGKRRSYTPDFRARKRNGRIVYLEYKPERWLKNPEIADLLKAAGDWIREEGDYDFEVITDTQVREGPRLANAKEMLRSRHLRFTERQVFRVTEALSGTRVSALGELWEYLGLPVERQGVVYAMAIMGHLNLDLWSAPLSKDTPVSQFFDFNNNGKY